MNKNQLKITGVFSTLLLSASLLALSTNYCPNYVQTILYIIAILIGFLPPYFSGGKYPMSKNETLKLSFISFGLALISLFVFAYESSMFRTLLIAAPLVWLFSYLAFRVNDRRVFKVKDFFRVLPIIIMLDFIFY